jgi:hypothetical protein
MGLQMVLEFRFIFPVVAKKDVGVSYEPHSMQNAKLPTGIASMKLCSEQDDVFLQ